jgi:hypothetical protein
LIDETTFMARQEVPKTLVLLAGLVAGCIGDHFLHEQGQVIECNTKTPLVGVAIALDDISSATPKRYSTIFQSDSNGEFQVDAAIQGGSTVKLSLSKDGFQTLETTIHGSSSTPLAVCLRPLTAPGAN